MLEGKYLLFCDSLDDVLAVRKSCEGKSYRDDLDSESIHAIVYEHNKPIACGRMLIDNDIYAFDRIYVIEQKRNNKVGDFVLRLLIEKAYLMCAKEVYIKSNNSSKDFFIKLLGKFLVLSCLFSPLNFKGLFRLRNEIKNKYGYFKNAIESNFNKLNNLGKELYPDDPNDKFWDDFEL